MKIKLTYYYFCVKHTAQNGFKSVDDIDASHNCWDIMENKNNKLKI